MEVSIYLHADKDAMWETGEKLGLAGDALSLFRHACTEVDVLHPHCRCQRRLSYEVGFVLKKTN